MYQLRGADKTTVAINQAVHHAQKGRRVIVLDMDRQRSASDFVTVRKGEELSIKTGDDPPFKISIGDTLVTVR